LKSESNFGGEMACAKATTKWRRREQVCTVKDKTKRKRKTMSMRVKTRDITLIGSSQPM